MAGLFWDPNCLAAKTVYNVNEQSSVTLICTSNSLNGKVKWTQGENTYSQDDTNSNYRINWKKSEISLTIKSADHSDAGEYVCEVDAFVGRAKCPAITLNVWNRLRYPNENQRAQSKESITLSCEIKRPNINIIDAIYWTHNSQEIKKQDERYDVKLLPSPSLKIHKVSDDDAGIYELRVKGSAYPSHSGQCIRLEVHPKVVPLENKYVAHEHTNITLHCETFGADTCKWKRNGNEITTGNRHKINDDMSLTISPVRQSDEGRYVCEVKSRAGITAASEEIELDTLPSEYSKLPPGYSQSTEMKEIEMNKIHDLMSRIPDDKSAWFYFIGRYGAGKSSTISSFRSVADCRISTVALPGGGERSFTREVSCTEIFGGKVKLFDSPGFDGTGEFDLKHFVPFTASFDDKAKGDQPFGVVVYVIDCSNELTKEELKSMQQVHEHVKLKDNLQMVALLTKMNQASQSAKEIPEILLSQKLCKVVEQINRMVQLPLNCIFAICSYYKEMDNDPTKDWLNLYTFRSLLERMLDVNERLKREKIVTVLSRR